MEDGSEPHLFTFYTNTLICRRMRWQHKMFVLQADGDALPNISKLIRSSRQPANTNRSLVTLATAKLVHRLLV